MFLLLFMVFYFPLIRRSGFSSSVCVLYMRLTLIFPEWTDNWLGEWQPLCMMLSHLLCCLLAQRTIRHIWLGSALGERQNFHFTAPGSDPWVPTGKCLSLKKKYYSSFLQLIQTVQCPQHHLAWQNTAAWLKPPLKPAFKLSISWK